MMTDEGVNDDRRRRMRHKRQLKATKASQVAKGNRRTRHTSGHGANDDRRKRQKATRTSMTTNAALAALAALAAKTSQEDMVTSCCQHILVKLSRKPPANMWSIGTHAMSSSRRRSTSTSPRTSARALSPRKGRQTKGKGRQPKGKERQPKGRGRPLEGRQPKDGRLTRRTCARGSTRATNTH